MELKPEWVDTLAAAFYDDPVVAHVLPDPELRRRWLPAGMEFHLRTTEGRGQVSSVADSAGVAALFGPGTYPIPLGATLRALYRAIRARKAGRVPLRSVARLLRLILVFEKHHLREPHWYVLTVGVRPDRQGQGLSRKTLQPMFDRADRDGVPCYLESSNPANIPIYQKFGFEVLRELRVWTDGPPVWLMVRKPGASAKAV